MFNIFINKNIYILLVGFLVITSCNNNNTQPAPQKDSLNSYSVKASDAKAAQQAVAEAPTKEIVIGKLGVRIAPEKLEKFLPAKIEGFRSSPPSSGRANDQNHDKTTCTRGYIGPQGQLITIQIDDFGGEKLPGSMSFFDKNSEETGFKYTRLDGNNSKAMMYWSDAGKEGKLYALYYKRFYINIHGENLKEENEASFKRLIDLVDIDAMVRFVSKLK